MTQTDETQGPAADGDRTHEVIEQRLELLHAEYETAQARLAEVERQEAYLRERLLMLRGAIQAVDDLRSELGHSGQDGPAAPPPTG
jgi:predicted nuclease with TOPRIM domain